MINYPDGLSEMQEEWNKKKILSDRALELVMRDVLNGLMDVSLQLSKECMETSTNEVSLTSHSTQDDRPVSDKDFNKT
jgi:hypothetical protein